VKFAFIASKEVAFPVLAMCKVLGVTRSGFYAWKKRPRSARAKADEQLVVDIAATHERSRKRYGSPRIHRALRKKGVRVGAKRVARLMRAANIVARQKRRFRRTTDSNHSNPVAPNVLAREFEPAAPNQTWAGDVTYVATGEGWSYLAVLLDLFSRRVIGWAMSTTNDTALALAALHRAVRARHTIPPGLVHHTDRGSPYASDDYRSALDEYSMLQSMSRTGDCWDNAVAESFFATLRAELVDHENYDTARAAERSIGDYIENFYNVERLHSHLDYVSPIEFELKMHIATIAA
jgi:putative transposase